jgi:predicted transcriptional regulator
MKALSIKQPWASLIAHGIKDIENRTWKTHFRGKIYIHASSKTKEMLSLLNKRQVEDIRSKSELDFDFPTSAIIGEVEITDCVINHPSIWAEKTFMYEADESGEKQIGKPIYNWVLANPVLYEKPIVNVKGKLSFWEFEK